jgi:hypothetical protein
VALNNSQKTLLPFIAKQQTEENSISDGAEKAIVICLAELDRQKGGGVFKKTPPEKVVFVSETYYPFWVVPFRNLTLLFDGLDLSSHSITYHSFPDTKAFIDNLIQRSSSRQAYAAFLSDNLNYFQGSNGEQAQVVEGLVSDTEFLNEVTEYVKEAETTDSTVKGVLVTPSQNEKQIVETLEMLEKLHSKLEKELEDLNEIIKTLNQQTQKALTGLREEIKATEDKFATQIEEVRSVAEEKKAQINKEYSDKVTQISDEFEQELIKLHKETFTLQKTAEQTEADIEKVENEIKNALVNKDEGAEEKLKEKKNELKRQLPNLLSEIKNNEAKVQEVEENKKNALYQLKEENEANLKAAENELVDVEASRDAEIKTCKDEMERIEDYTSTIIGKIDQLTKISEAAINDFDNFGVPHEQQSNLLVYMPFYLICYQAGAKKRCNYVAPSIVGDDGFGARLRGLGKKKIEYLFQPRSQKIVSVLNRFLTLLDENIAFSHEIHDACGKANLLASKEKVEHIRAGLLELRAADLLSESEFEAFNQTLPQA